MDSDHRQVLVRGGEATPYHARNALDGVLDLLFPRRCVSCRAAGAWLCEPCAAGLVPLADVRCPRCGAPGDWSRRPCPECGGRDMAFAAATAAFAYTGPARDLVTACKFRALRSIVDEMVARARPAFAGVAGPDTLVTWVPGHRDHKLERGFNQAELLARGLARSVHAPYAPLLRRLRHGARQSGLDKAARRANVQHAFVLREDAKRVLINLKRVVIIDDVYTTGETLNHCADALAQAGSRPHVFTFARTVRATASTAAPRRVTLPKERCR